MLIVAGAGRHLAGLALTLLSSFVSTHALVAVAHTWIGASRKGRLPDNGTETCTVALTASVRRPVLGRAHVDARVVDAVAVWRRRRALRLEARGRRGVP